MLECLYRKYCNRLRGSSGGGGASFLTFLFKHHYFVSILDSFSFSSGRKAMHVIKSFYRFDS